MRTHMSTWMDGMWEQGGRDRDARAGMYDRYSLLGVEASGGRELEHLRGRSYRRGRGHSPATQGQNERTE